MQVTVQDGGVDSPTCYYNYCAVMYVDNSIWICVHWLFEGGLFHMLKNDLLCYSPMLPKVAYYAIDSYHYSILCFIKEFNEIYCTAQNSCFQSSQYVLIHRPFSTTLQQINKDVTLFLLSDKLILFRYSH